MHFGRKVEERHNNDSCDDDNNEIIENQNQRKAEVAETAPSCNYCVATIVARQLLTTEGVETSLPGYREIKLNVLDSVDSRIRRGLGTETFIILYEFLASLSCLDLNLINI